MRKKLTAVILSTMIALQTCAVPVTAQAAETEKEYIVLVKDEEALEEVLEGQKEEIVEEENAEVLEEQQIVVLELTDREARKLERDKDVLFVEENITLDACTLDSVYGEEPQENGGETAESGEQPAEGQEPEGKTEEDMAEAGDVTEETAVTAVPTEAEKGKKEKKEKKEKNVKKEKNTKKEKEKGKNAEKMKKEEEGQDNDLTGEQWNLEAVRLNGTAAGRDAVRIGLLDSGVSFDTDIDVAQRLTVSDGDEETNVLFDDATGHGTAMAGIIAAKDDGDRIRGINPGAEVYSIQILDGNNQTTLSRAVAGIYQGIESGCDILNMSFGTWTDSEILHEAVRSAYDAGILLVGAAGNAEGKAVQYPAAYREVMAVGSSDTAGNRAAGTCDGEEIEVFAPGSQILTTGLFGGTIVTEGTSIAAAQVSGAASLLWSADRTKSAGFIRSLLANTAQTMGNSGMSGAGLLDIENAAGQYKSFEAVYKENVVEYAGIQKGSRDAEEFSGVDLITGSWSGNNHATMAGYSAGDTINSKNLQLMKEAAKEPDANYKDVSYLHATGNYVKSLKFLYKCAEYLKAGKGIETAAKNAASVAGISTDPKTHEGKLVDATKKMLNTSLLPNVPESSYSARCYKVMGFAMHLTGDIYAHRTMVPQYTVDGGNTKAAKDSKDSTSASARFGTSDFGKEQEKNWHENDVLIGWAKSSHEKQDEICKNWKCFQKTVKLGVMEFKDIKNFSNLTVKKAQSTYEDNPSFCKERYEDAELACKRLFNNFYYQKKYSGITILCPTKKYVKLNNLKGYAKECGEDTSCFTGAKWDEVSTPKFY